MKYAQATFSVERVGAGVLLTIQLGDGQGTIVHFPGAADAQAVGLELVKCAVSEPDLEAELAQIESCRASIVQPASDAHVCLCLSAPHDGPHQCEDCGTRWSG